MLLTLRVTLLVLLARARLLSLLPAHVRGARTLLVLTLLLPGHCCLLAWNGHDESWAAISAASYRRGWFRPSSRGSRRATVKPGNPRRQRLSAGLPAPPSGP